jgi:hypothetical protein
MVIDQRNAGAEVNPAVNGTYYLDRWRAATSAASKFKIGQNAGAVTPPTGFINYLGLTSLSAYTVGASEVFGVIQIIEGLNVADLDWGATAASAGKTAATVTLSFWVRSSLTGTFGGSLRNDGSTRAYPFTYTISVANTWEQKTVTIAGDTSGTWLTTNGIGINLTFSIGSGSTLSGTAGAWASANLTSATGATSVVGTNGATFYITGVQLEKGTQATAFDYRDYGNELRMCQRYYQFVNTSSPALGAGYYGSMTSGQPVYSILNFPVAFRSGPTVIANTLNSNVGVTSLASISGYATAAFVAYGNASGTTTNGYTFFNYTASAEL